MIKFLITGFGQFREFERNTSEAVVNNIRRERFNDVEIHSDILEVTFDGSKKEMELLLEKTQPDIVLMLGLHAGIPGFEINKMAININDDGETKKDEVIDSDGPAAYFSRFPVSQLVAALNRGYVPTFLAYNAGTFVCNHLFYSVARFIKKKGWTTLYGFVHLPCLPDEAIRLGSNFASMEIERVMKGIRIVIIELCEHFLVKKRSTA